MVEALVHCGIWINKRDSGVLRLDLGLTGYFVDQRQQGRGIGTGGVRALRDYLRREFPDAAAVVLTVNVQNSGAVKAYRRGGFVDTGDLFHGGRSGPQHVMRMGLGA